MSKFKSSKYSKHLEQLASEEQAADDHELDADELKEGRKRKRTKLNRRPAPEASTNQPPGTSSQPRTNAQAQPQSTPSQGSNGPHEGRGRRAREDFIRDTLNAATGATRSKSAGHEEPRRSSPSATKPADSTPAEPNIAEDEDEEMADKSESSDDEGGCDAMPGEAKYVKMLKEIYRGRPDKAAHKALLSLLEELSSAQDSSQKKSGQTYSKSGAGGSDLPPWDQDELYVCTIGPQHREKRRIALAGYIRHVIFQLLKREGSKSPLPAGPPPEVAAPTALAFYLKWDESEKSLFNATAARIVSLQVANDWPSLFKKNFEEVFEMATFHIKYLRTCYKRQNNPNVAATEAERHRRCNADTRKRTLYAHRLRIINAVPALGRHGRLMEALGIEGTSSDEEDSTRPGTYIIKRRKQLSSQVQHLKGQLDQAYAIRFKGPGSKGNQLRRRIDTGILSARRFNIQGLPLSCIDQGWLITLTDVQKDMFEFRNIDYDFSFPKELLEAPN